MNDPDVMNTVVNMVFQVRNVTYERPEVQALLKKSSKNSGPRYDLLVVDCIFNEFLLPLAHHLGIPSVYISPSMLFPPIAWNLNIPRPAYLSSSLSSGDKGTSLISRGLNAFGNLMFLTMRNRNILSKHDEYIKNILPGTPPLIELERNVSFVMTHTHPSLYPSSPSMPYTADIACILCRPAKALPKVKCLE